MDIKIRHRIRILRDFSTYRQAAEMCGLTAGHWKNLEEGKNTPTLRTAQKMASGYGVDPEWILEGKGKGPKVPIYEGTVSEFFDPYKGLDLNKQKRLRRILRWLEKAADEDLTDLDRHFDLLERATSSQRKNATSKN